MFSKEESFSIEIIIKKVYFYKVNLQTVIKSLKQIPGKIIKVWKYSLISKTSQSAQHEHFFSRE